MAKHTVTAFFDDRENADNAVLMLRRYAIPDGDVTVSPKEAATGYAEQMSVQVKSFWSFLDRLFGGSTGCNIYAEGVRRGHVMVVAHIDDGNVADAISILERCGAIDLSERESAWRNDGWTAGSTSAANKVAVSNEGSPLPGPPAFRSQVDKAAAGVLATSSARDAYRTSSRMVDAAPSLHPNQVAPPGAQKFTWSHLKAARVHSSPHLGDQQPSASTNRDHATVGADGSNHTVKHGSTAAPSAKVQRAVGLEVVGCDGQHVGIIDHVEGVMITLKQLDPSSCNLHRSIPTSWVQSIDDRVMLKLSAADAMSRWSVE